MSLQPDRTVVARQRLQRGVYDVLNTGLLYQL